MDLQGFTTIDEVGDDDESFDKEVRNSNQIFSPHSAAEEIDYLNKIISDMEKDDKNNFIGRDRTDFDLNSKIVLGNYSENVDLKNCDLSVDNLDKLKPLEVNINSSISINFQLEKDKVTTQHSLVNEDHNFRSKEIGNSNNSKSCKLISQNNSVEECDKISDLENSEMISCSDKHNSSHTLCSPKSSTEHVPCENSLGAAVAKSSETSICAVNDFEDISSNADCVNRNNDNSALHDDEDYINITLPIHISCIKTEPIDKEQSEVDFGEYFNDPAEDFDINSMHNIKEELDFDRETACMSIQPIDTVSIAKLEPVDHEESVYTTFVPKVHFKIKRNFFYSKEQVTAAAIMAQSSLALVINMNMFENLKLTMPVVECYRLENISPDNLLFEDLEMVDIFFAKYSNNPRKWRKICKLRKRSHKETKERNSLTKLSKNSLSSNKLKKLQEQYREAINRTIAKTIDENYQNSEVRGESFELSSKLKYDKIRKVDEKNSGNVEKLGNYYNYEKNKDKIKSNKNKNEYEQKHLSKKKTSVKIENFKNMSSSKHKHNSQKKNERTINISSPKESSDVHDKSFEGFSPEFKQGKWKQLLLFHNIKPCIVNLSRDVSLIPTQLLDNYKTNIHRREHSGHKHKKEKHKRSKDKKYSEDRNKKEKHKDFKKEKHKGRPRLSENFQSPNKNVDNLVPKNQSSGDYMDIAEGISSTIVNVSNVGEEKVKEKFPISIANSNIASEGSKLKNEQNFAKSANISHSFDKNTSSLDSQKEDSLFEVSHNITGDIIKSNTISTPIKEDTEPISASTNVKDVTEAFTENAELISSTPVKDNPIILSTPLKDKNEPISMVKSVIEERQSSDVSSNSFSIQNENSSFNENQNTSDSEVKNSNLSSLIESNKDDNYHDTDFKSFNKIISSNVSEDSCNPVAVEIASNKHNESSDIKGIDSFFSPSKLKDFSFDNDEKIFQEKVLKTNVDCKVNNSETCKNTDSHPTALIDGTSTKIDSTNSHSKLPQEDEVIFDKIKNDDKIEGYNNDQNIKEVGLSESKREVEENSKNRSKELDKTLNKNNGLEKDFKSLKKASKPKKLKKCYVLLENIYYNKLYRKKIKKEIKYWEKKKRKSFEAKAYHSVERTEAKSDAENLDSAKKSKRYNEKYFAVHPNLKNNVPEEKKQVEVNNYNSKTAEIKKKTLKEVPLFGLSFKIPKKNTSKEKVDNKPQSLIQRNEAQTPSYYGSNNKFKPFNKDKEKSKKERDFSKGENLSGGKKTFESSSHKDKPVFFLNFNPDLMRKEWEKEKQNDFKPDQPKTPMYYDRMKNLKNRSDPQSILKKGSTEEAIKTENKFTDHHTSKLSRPIEGYNKPLGHHISFMKSSIDGNTNKIQQNFSHDDNGETLDNSDVDSTSSVISKLKKKLLNSSVTQPHSSSNLTPKSTNSSLNRVNFEKNQEDAIKTIENSGLQSTFSVISKLRQNAHNNSDNQTPTLSSLKPAHRNESFSTNLHADVDVEDSSIGDAPNSPCDSYGSPQSFDNSSVRNFNQSSLNPSILVTESKEEKVKSIETTDMKVNNDGKDNFTPAEEDLAFYKKVDSLGKKEKLKLYIKYKALYNTAKKKFLEEPGDIHKSPAKLKRYRELNMRRKLYYDLKLYLYEQKKQQYASKKQEYEALKEYQKYSVKKQDKVPLLSADKKEPPTPLTKSVPDGKPYSPSIVIDGDIPYSPSRVLDGDISCSPSHFERGNEPYSLLQNVRRKPSKQHTPPTGDTGDEPYSPSTAFDDEPYSPSASPILSVCWKSPSKEKSQFKHTVSSDKRNVTQNRQKESCDTFPHSNSSTTTVVEEKPLTINLKQKSSDEIEDIAFFHSQKKKLLETQKSQESSDKVISPKLRHQQELDVNTFDHDKKTQVQDIVEAINDISPPGSPIIPLDVNSSFITSTSALTTVLKKFVESEQCDNLDVNNKSAIESNKFSDVDRNVNTFNNVNSNTEKVLKNSVENENVNPGELSWPQSNFKLTHSFIGNNSNKELPLPVSPPLSANHGKMNNIIPIVQSEMMANDMQHVITPTTNSSLSSPIVHLPFNQQNEMPHNTIQQFKSKANDHQAHEIPLHKSDVLSASYGHSHVLPPVSTQGSYKAGTNQILGVVAEETNKVNPGKVEIDVKNIGISLATALLLPPPPPPPSYPATAINATSTTDVNTCHDCKDNINKKEDKEETKYNEKSSFASIISEFFDNWKDPTNEDPRSPYNELNSQENNSDCKILYSKLSSSKNDLSSMVAALYERKPLAQPLIDKVDNVPLVGLQYVLEVQPEEKCSLENTSYICGLCSKKMSSATLVAHVKSVPHRLKYTECFSAELHEKFGKMEVKQWTAALVKEFTSSLLEVEKKNGRQCMPVAPEKSMNSAVNLLKNDLTSLLKGKEKGKSVSSEKPSPAPTPAPASSSFHKPSKHQSKELSPRHSKRPLETNDKPGPKSSKLPRSEPQRSRERGSGFEKEKDRDVHPRSDRENFRGVREPNKERSREPRGRKSPSPVHRRRLSPSPRNRSRDSPRKKSRTRSPTSLPTPRDDQYRQKSRTRSPLRQERFSRFETAAPRRDERNNDRKLFDFREDESRAKKETTALLERYLKNPESHPRYKTEWERFWDRRCREVKQQGYDIKYFDLTSEWIDFWPIRLKEICVVDYKERREEFLTRYRIDDPDFGDVKTDFLDFIELPKPKAPNSRNNLSSERSRSPWKRNEKPHEVESGISQEFIEPGFSVVGTLKLLTNLEDQLGSLYPGTKALLEKATYVTESGGNAMNLFENNDNIVLLRLANVKLSSLLSSGILGMMTSARTQRAIECTNWVLKEAEKFSPNSQSKRIESLGLDLNLMSTATIGMNTMQIAQYIAQQLFNIGKSDVDETVLQEILMAISENHTQYKLKTQAEESYGGSNFLPSASVNQGAVQISNSDQSYANQVQQSGDRGFSAVPALFPSGAIYGRDMDQSKVTPDITSNEMPKNTALSLLQSAYDHEEEAGKDKKDMDKLSLEELQKLLFNFKNLSTDEQQELTSYLKKLEATDNKKVTKLRSMMQNYKPTIQKVQQEKQTNLNTKSGTQNIQSQKDHNDSKNYYNRPYSFEQGYSKDSKHYNNPGEFEDMNSNTSGVQYSKNYDHNQPYGGQQQISDFRKDESFSQNQALRPPMRNDTPKSNFDDTSAGNLYQNVAEPVANQFESTYSYNQSKAPQFQGEPSAYRDTFNSENSQHSRHEDIDTRQPLLSTPGMVSSRKPLLDHPEMNPRQPLLVAPDSSSRQPLLATPEAVARQPLLANPKHPLLPNPRDEQPPNQSPYFDKEFQSSKHYSDKEYHEDYQPKSNVGNFSDDSQAPFSGKRKSLLLDPQDDFGFQRKEYRLGNFSSSSTGNTSNYQSNSAPSFAGNYSSDRFNEDNYGTETSQNDTRPYNSFYNQENEPFDESESGGDVSSDFVSESFRNFSSSFSNNPGQGGYQPCDDEPTNEGYDNYNSSNKNFNRSFPKNRGGFSRGRGRRANKFKPR